MPHHLAQILRPAGDRVAHRGADVLRRRLGGEELFDHPDFRRLFGLQVLAPALGVHLDRLAAPLDPPAQDLDGLRVGNGALELDVAVLEVGEDRRKEQRAGLMSVLPGLVHGHAQPVGQARQVAQ